MANLSYIQITRKCNQRCRFCSNPVSCKTISLSKIKSLIDVYVSRGYDGVVLSGGEPTCHGKLPNIIKYAKHKKFLTKIITNGQKTADNNFLDILIDAGLDHISVSIYSDDSEIQNFLTGNPDSFKNITKTFSLLSKKKITVDVLTAICKYNAGHLDRIVYWLTKNYGFITHFVWNNLDPKMNKASENPDTVPSLADFEISLNKAMQFLVETGRTFRVERVPLCYMAEFAAYSTEARKIIKKEIRATYFLDGKGLKVQKGWLHDKAPCCNACTLTNICPGLYSMDEYYSSKELYPVFVDNNRIVNRVLKENDDIAVKSQCKKE